MGRDAAVSTMVGAALLALLKVAPAPVVPHRLYYLESRIPVLDSAAVAAIQRPNCVPPGAVPSARPFEGQVTMIMLINPLKRPVEDVRVAFRPENVAPILAVSTSWDGDFGGREDVRSLSCDRSGRIGAHFRTIGAQGRVYFFVAAETLYEVDSDEDEGAVVSGGNGTKLAITQLKEDDYRRFSGERLVYFAAGLLAALAGLVSAYLLRRRRLGHG